MPVSRIFSDRFKTNIGVIFILKRKELFLLQRRINTSWMNDCYGLFGGSLEHGETITDAVLREAEEELGIKIKEKDTKLVHVLHLLHKEAYHSINLFFQIKKWQGEPKVMEPDKCRELLWVSKESFPEKTVPFLKTVLERIDLGIIYSEHGWK